MRKDMAKVVTERPRHGGKYADRLSGKTRGKIRCESDTFYDEVRNVFIEDYDNVDSGPNRISAGQKPYGYNRKQFSDLINPLRRYLRKQVGRPWNDVHSELAQTLDRRSMAGRHIWEHVMSEVDVDTHFEADGKLYSRRYSFLHEFPLATGLYVHPTTGRLEWTNQKRYDYPKRDEFWQYNRPTYVLGDGTKLEQHNGIWYHVTVEKTNRKVWNGYTLVDGVVTSKWKDETKVIKRQLNKSELKAGKLVNYHGPIPTDPKLAKRYGFA